MKEDITKSLQWTLFGALVGIAFLVFGIDLVGLALLVLDKGADYWPPSNPIEHYAWGAAGTAGVFALSALVGNLCIWVPDFFRQSGKHHD